MFGACEVGSGSVPPGNDGVGFGDEWLRTKGKLLADFASTFETVLALRSA